VSISSNATISYRSKQNSKLEVKYTGKGLEDFAESVARRYFVKVFPEMDIETIFDSKESIENLIANNPNKILILREFRDYFCEIVPEEFRDFTQRENQKHVHIHLKKNNHGIFRQDYDMLEKYEEKHFAIDFVFLVIVNGEAVYRYALETYGKEYNGPLNYIENSAITRYLRIVESRTMKERSGITFISHTDVDKYKEKLLPMYFAKRFKKLPQ